MQYAYGIVRKSLPGEGGEGIKMWLSKIAIPLLLRRFASLRPPCLSRFCDFQVFQWTFVIFISFDSIPQRRQPPRESDESTKQTDNGRVVPDGFSANHVRNYSSA